MAINAPLITKPTPGGDEKTWGNVINVNYDNQELFYADIENAINFILDNMAITREELQDLLDEGNLLIITLDAKIVEGNILLSELNNSISTGDQSKIDLDASIVEADTSKTNLDGSITTGDQLKIGLDASIVTGDATKVALDGSITTGTQLKIGLDASITTGDILKDDLDTSITTGDSTKTALDGSITTGDQLKINLDGSISTGTTLNDDLEQNIIDGTILSDEIESQISGGDLLVKGAGFDNGTYPNIKSITDIIEGESAVVYYNTNAEMIADLTLVVNQRVDVGAELYKVVAGVQPIVLDNGLYAELLQDPQIGINATNIGTNTSGIADIVSTTGYACIVNATGTGAENEIVDANLPINITISSRYVLTNPFGINKKVYVEVEVFSNGKWANPSFAWLTGGRGTFASCVIGEGIIIQTGGTKIKGISTNTGNPFGDNIEETSAPCRVHVWRVGI